MTTTTYRKTGLVSCLVLSLLIGGQTFAVPAYALDVNSFTQNPAALLQSGPNVGANVLSLATDPQNPVPAGALASALGAGQGMQASLGQATSVIQNLTTAVQGGQITPEAATNLLTSMAGNAMPPELTQALSTLQGLGSIVGSSGNIQSLINNPAIQNALQGALPAEQAQMVQQILDSAIQGGAQGLSQAASTALAGALQAQAPELAQMIQQFGPGALQTIIGAAGGSGVGGAVGGAGSAGGGSKDTGNYQLQSLATDSSPKNNACGACSAVGNIIAGHYRDVRQKLKEEFIKHRTWMVNDYWKKHVLPAMMLMAEQLSVVGIQQVEMFGTMLDAKHQLETQRLFQQLAAEAHKDYQPSEGMCTFGTTVRSLAASERKSNLIQIGLAGRMMQRQTLNGDVLSFEGPDSDIRARLVRFAGTYCDKADNANGLENLCVTVREPERRNIDVDYTRNVESRLTLDLDMIDGGQAMAAARKELNDAQDAITRKAAQDKIAKLQANGGGDKPDQEDLFALAANLYSHNVAEKFVPEKLGDGKKVRQDGAERYMDLRAIYAKRSVAQNSFAAITAMRASGDDGSAPYTKALIKELGVSDEDDINKILGEKPSYFAQMEVLTKKIYQNPTFYTELYDKPVNVERKGAAIQAISLMQDRDLYNSLLRSEAVLSVLLETMLVKEQEKAVNAMSKLKARE